MSSLFPEQIAANSGKIRLRGLKILGWAFLFIYLEKYSSPIQHLCITQGVLTATKTIKYHKTTTMQ